MFVGALIERDYARAYSLTTAGYQARVALPELRRQFEHSCPPSYGDFDTPAVIETMDRWPARRPGELRWLYVTVGGQADEAVAVVVAREGSALRISDVEVGRP